MPDNYTPVASTINNLSEYLQNLANAIRTKVTAGGPYSGTLNAQEFDEAIYSIESVGDLTGADFVAADLLSGKLAYGNGGATITGTMPNIGAETISLYDRGNGSEQAFISRGYHNGNGIASVQAVTIAPIQMSSSNATIVITDGLYSRTQGDFISGDVVITPMQNASLGSGDSNIDAQTISAAVTATGSAGLNNIVSAASTNYSISFSGTISQFGQSDQVTVSVPVTASGYLGSATLSHQITFDPATTLTKPSNIYLKETSQQWGQSPATGATVSTFTPNFNSAFIFNTSAGVVGADNAVQLSRENLQNYNIAAGATIFGIAGTYVTDLYEWSPITLVQVLNAPSDESDDASTRRLSIQSNPGGGAKQSFNISGASLSGKLLTMSKDSAGAVSFNATGLEAVSSGSIVQIGYAQGTAKAVANSSVVHFEWSGAGNAGTITIVISDNATQYLLGREY